MVGDSKQVPGPQRAQPDKPADPKGLAAHSQLFSLGSKFDLDRLNLTFPGTTFEPTVSRCE